MSEVHIFSRINTYYRKHGAIITAHRALVSMKRLLMGNRMVIFYCDLTMAEFDKNSSFGHFTVERRNSQDEISDEEMERLLSYWNRDIKLRQIRERFAKGAILWLAKSKSETTGLGGSIGGKTIRHYFFPLRRAH